MILLRPVALMAVAVLLAGCQDDPVADCDVDVATSELQEARTAAGIADCTSGEGGADLPDLTLPCLGSDAEVDLTSIEGPAVINFWASWCDPCRAELPALEAFHEQYGDQVSVLGVMWQDSYPEAALDLAARSGVTYPSLADPCGATGDTDLAITGLPIFVFVAEDGSVSRAQGGIDTAQEMAALVEEHLGLELT